MIYPGLVSITFRELSPERIVDLVADAQLSGIEWGGDIHVPQGDIAQAKVVRALTEQAGLKVAAYGSYYCVGDEPIALFEPVLEAALELGAPIIRVWAGNRGSDSAGDEYRKLVVEESRRIADLAAKCDIRIACEWHGNTLTDSVSSGLSLLKTVDCDNFGTYWQPSPEMATDQCLDELEVIKPWLRGLHVYSLDVETGDRLALADGQTAWKQYMAAVGDVGDMFALMEFVADDDPAAFLRDAATLKGWLANQTPEES